MVTSFIGYVRDIKNETGQIVVIDVYEIRQSNSNSNSFSFDSLFHFNPLFFKLPFPFTH